MNKLKWSGFISSAILEILSMVAVAAGGYLFFVDGDFEMGIFLLLLAIWAGQKSDF